MIKVKEFRNTYKKLYNMINEFISDSNIQVIDIKYVSVQTNNGSYTSALVIYDDLTPIHEKRK